MGNLEFCIWQMRGGHYSFKTLFIMCLLSCTKLSCSREGAFIRGCTCNFMPKVLLASLMTEEFFSAGNNSVSNFHPVRCWSTYIYKANGLNLGLSSQSSRAHFAWKVIHCLSLYDWMSSSSQDEQPYGQRYWFVWRGTDSLQSGLSLVLANSLQFGLGWAFMKINGLGCDVRQGKMGREQNKNKHSSC